ncbi:MAG: TIGR00300 family protein [Acidobacteria bacterium]|nr:TIGR00300 family protein [Acidobacteriota bacterium]MBI3658069.1 TIGR00300 family protein [Acidobacteriota bacterium]
MDNTDEIVEIKGHLIDSGIMSSVLDQIIKGKGSFEIFEFIVGKTNEDFSTAKIRIHGHTREDLGRILENLHELGCYITDSQDARLCRTEKAACVPDDFYSTTNHKTFVRLNGDWVMVREQRMDAVVAVEQGRPRCKKLRDVKAGDLVVCGVAGVKVIPEAKARDRNDFSFMDSEISSEKKASLGVKKLAAIFTQIKAAGGKIVVVAGPVVVHTGGVEPLADLIRNGFVDVLLGGNAIAVHDIEHALYATSLGVDLNTGIPVAHGHKNHMRAINTINRYGSIAAAVEQGALRSGILFECVKKGIPYVLAGSIRDDGPLPDVTMDMIAAQEAYAKALKGARLVLMLSTMLHSIGTGNMIPSEVMTVCVDINPAVVTKLADRGSAQAIGVVTDVGLFLNLLTKELIGKT